MKDNHSTRGRWWINGKSKPPLSGTLDTTGGNLKLSIWTPQDVSVDQIVRNMVSQQEEEVPRVITGTDENNKPVTLFGCGLSFTNIAQGFRQWDIDAIAAIKGVEIGDWQQPIVRSILIKPRFFHRWFGRKLISVKPGETSFSSENPINLEFPIESGVRIRFVDQTSSSSSLDEIQFIHDGQIWFHFDNARALAEISDRWIPWASHLLGLLLGVPCEIDNISIFLGDPFQPGEGPHDNCPLILSGSNSGRKYRREPHPSSMIVPFREISSSLAHVVTGWNRVSTQYGPVVALFGAIALRRELHLETRFLYLVQALEIYHMCSNKFPSAELPENERQKMLAKAQGCLPSHVWNWAQGKLTLNSRPLTQKLSDLFKAHPEESGQLLGDSHNVASRIAYTRNHLTHHSENVNKGRLIPADEMGAISWKMEALLWIILLREIGLEGKCIKRVINKVTDIRTITC
jgi:hypothetical protein